MGADFVPELVDYIALARRAVVISKAPRDLATDGGGILSRSPSREANTDFAARRFLLAAMTMIIATAAATK